MKTSTKVILATLPMAIPVLLTFIIGFTYPIALLMGACIVYGIFTIPLAVLIKEKIDEWEKRKKIERRKKYKRNS